MPRLENRLVRIGRNAVKELTLSMYTVRLTNAKQKTVTLYKTRQNERMSMLNAIIKANQPLVNPSNKIN